MNIEDTYDAFIQFAEYYGWEYTTDNIYKWFGDYQNEEDAS